MRRRWAWSSVVFAGAAFLFACATDSSERDPRPSRPFTSSELFVGYAQGHWDDTPSLMTNTGDFGAQMAAVAPVLARRWSLEFDTVNEQGKPSFFLEADETWRRGPFRTGEDLQGVRASQEL